jgi:hypothetical protein
MKYGADFLNLQLHTTPALYVECTFARAFVMYKVEELVLFSKRTGPLVEL